MKTLGLTTISSLYKNSKYYTANGRKSFIAAWLLIIGSLGFVAPVHAHGIIGITQCTSNSFTIQVTNFAAGNLVAQLVAPGVDVVVNTTFNIGSQTIVAVRPANLPGGTYRLNLYVNGNWVAGADVTLCAVAGVGVGPAIIGITQCNSNSFTIQVTNFTAGTLSAQLMSSSGSIISLNTAFDVGTQAIVVTRPPGLAGGTYHLNLSLNGALVANANVTLCNVSGGSIGTGPAIIGLTQCNSNSFTIQVTNFAAGNLVAQLVATGVDVVVNTTFNVGSQTIVAARPANLPGGTYRLNLYMNGNWVAGADVTLCAVAGVGVGPAIIGITQCNSNSFTIQVTNFTAGTLSAQLMTSSGSIISLNTAFDVGAQAIVVTRPSGLAGGTYHLNLSLNGALVANANVTLCNVSGGSIGTGPAIIGLIHCSSNSLIIQVTNFPAGSVVAQLLLSPSGEVILQTSFDFSSQTIVAVRPPNLPAGTYHLNLYLNGTWLADANITLCSSESEGPTEGETPGGRTLGFWSNKNGQALITAADLQALRDLCLRTTSGTDFTVNSKAAFRTWILGANGRNMASMLSAQLAATYLSVQHGFTDPSVVVDGSLTVSALINYANSLLCADGSTLSGDANRAEQERVKNILDRINNGGSFSP
jgi:hypothetical protein